MGCSFASTHTHAATNNSPYTWSVSLYLCAWLMYYLHAKDDVGLSLPFNPSRVLKVNMVLFSHFTGWIGYLPLIASYLHWRYWKIGSECFKQIVRCVFMSHLVGSSFYSLARHIAWIYLITTTPSWTSIILTRSQTAACPASLCLSTAADGDQAPRWSTLHWQTHCANWAMLSWCLTTANTPRSRSTAFTKTFESPSNGHTNMRVNSMAIQSKYTSWYVWCC